MKKIENIIHNCNECKWRVLYKAQKQGKSDVFICDRIDSKRIITIVKSKGTIEIPDWCPLETYNEAKKSKAQLTATADNCSTSILSGMPNLEWMTENLTGHGGTEIDGNWYYTWEQAMDAVAELGDGWRLPTSGELQRLCDAGSTWVDKGPDGMPGRWFGGNHDTDHIGSLFFPASGYIYAGTDTVAHFGAEGGCWSSNLNSVDSTHAGHLFYHIGKATPFYCSEQTHMLSVRCVRERRKG